MNFFLLFENDKQPKWTNRKVPEFFINRSRRIYGETL